MLRALGIYALTMLGFGSEGPLTPAPHGHVFHHEGITRRGSRQWPSATPRDGEFLGGHNALAFHADYLDSYAYSPLWWLDPTHGGGLDRLAVALSSRRDLTRLHFDDLFSNEQVERAWWRYLAGTVCGLLHLADSDLDEDVSISCAHNLVGCSLHAIQDFYSHSNWVDEPARRRTTWFEAGTALVHDASLHTGAYERDEHLGVHAHGVVEPVCSVLRTLPLAEGVLGVVCHAASPLTKGPLCSAHRRCAKAVSVRMPAYAGVSLPRGVAYVSPGMNLDSSWQSPLGVQVRGIPDLDGPEAFGTAYALAVRSTCQWLGVLDRLMLRGRWGDASIPRVSEWWERVRSRDVSLQDYKTDLAPFERFDLRPYTFLSAGDYPAWEDERAENHWFLRVVITTGSDGQANTNARIEPSIDGDLFDHLDHGLGGRSIEAADLTYNDFSRNSVTAYTIGPVVGEPRELTLTNTAPSFTAVLLEIGKAIVSLVRTVVDAIGEGLMTLRGGHADRVQSATGIVTADELERLTAIGDIHDLTISCDGGSEGHYEVVVEVELRSGVLVGDRREYAVRVTTVRCVRESSADRGSGSDEIFVVGITQAHGSGMPGESWRTPLFDHERAFDRDGVERTVTSIEHVVSVPLRWGFLTVPVEVWESDDETDGDRDDIQADFARHVKNAEEHLEQGLLEMIGASMGQAWQCATLSAVAFHRGEQPTVVRYAPLHVDRWIDGGDTVSYPLQETGRTSRDLATALTEAGAACTGLEEWPEPPDLPGSNNPDDDPDAPWYDPERWLPEDHEEQSDPEVQPGHDDEPHHRRRRPPSGPKHR